MGACPGRGQVTLWNSVFVIGIIVTDWREGGRRGRETTVCCPTYSAFIRPIPVNSKDLDDTLTNRATQPGPVTDDLFVFLDFCLFLESGREGEREGGKHQCVVACDAPHTGDLAHSPGRRPDGESNR